MAIHIRYGKIYIVNLPYMKGDKELRRSQEFIEEGKFWEAQQRYEQRAEDREKMGLEDKDPAKAKAWRCPSEQELRLREEEELHESNDSNRKEIVKEETLLEAKSQHDMATREWTPLYEHNEQEKEMNKEASAANTTDDKQQPRQHNNSEQAEKYEVTGNAARSPEIISDGTCTPAKPENMIMMEQSPTDVSSLPWIEDLERNQLSSKHTSPWFTEKENADLERCQLSKNARENTGDEMETQAHEKKMETTKRDSKQKEMALEGRAVHEGPCVQSKQKCYGVILLILMVAASART